MAQVESHSEPSDSSSIFSSSLLVFSALVSSVVFSSISYLFESSTDGLPTFTVIFLSRALRFFFLPRANFSVSTSCDTSESETRVSNTSSSSVEFVFSLSVEADGMFFVKRTRAFRSWWCFLDILVRFSKRLLLVRFLVN